MSTVRSALRSALLSLALLLALTLAPASAQDSTGLDDVRAAYHDLLDLFYRPLDGRDLLQAGWTALQTDAEGHGAPAAGSLPELPADPNAAFDVFAAAYTTYLANLPSSLSPAAAAADVASGMTDSVHEQHTHYLPPRLMQNFLSTVGGGQEAVGLGIKLAGGTPGLIAEVAPDGPAARAGVMPGDVIVGADDRDLRTADAATLAAVLTGPAGSQVTLSIDRGAGPESISVTRGPYYFPPLDSRMVADGVGYLRLTDFVISGTTLPNGTELLSDLDRRLDELDTQGMQGLVLDLRNNGGGSVQTADELLGRFLPDSTKSVREFDQRGHETFELASGRMHARQVPMAVLINTGSASASEVTAAALRDAHRAVLVGQRTAGAVASSELLPLPSGAGIQVAVAAVSSAYSRAELDGVGVTPDVAAAESRTLADYRIGRDPQIDAAVAALANAPAPSVVSPSSPPLSQAELDRLLEAVLPTDVPTNDRMKSGGRWQRLDFMHPNEVVDQNGGAPDPIALQGTMRIRGYQGSVFAAYGASPGDLPSVSVNADLYATIAGAHSAVSANDLPFIQVPIEPPARPGDETYAYRGQWLATGATVLAWRHGRVVITVTYSDAPGFDRPDTIATLASVVDDRARQLSLP